MNRKHITIVSAFVCTLVLGPYASAQSIPTSSQNPSIGSSLTKFDLDFPGGTPQELVSAIQKSIARPLNVIIPIQFADVKLPPFQMKHVDTAQLFRALGSASPAWAMRINPSGQNDFVQTKYAFRTDGTLSDDSVWYFTADMPPTSEHHQGTARFFNLSTYLNQGLTIDDITTAIQTGWKMAGNSDGAELSYHKETRLLIVVGNSTQFDTVTNALYALTQQSNVVPSGSSDIKTKSVSYQSQNNEQETKKPEK